MNINGLNDYKWSGVNEWSVWCQPVEVGCRGLAGQSVWKTLGLIGVLGKARRDTIRDMSQAAEDGSRWIWHKR